MSSCIKSLERRQLKLTFHITLSSPQMRRKNFNNITLILALPKFKQAAIETSSENLASIYLQAVHSHRLIDKVTDQLAFYKHAMVICMIVVSHCNEAVTFNTHDMFHL